MGQDFLNFFVLYSLLTVMFAIVGNMNYILYMKEFNGFFTSILTVIESSLGTFNFTIFEKAPDELALIGQIYIIVLVIAFNILLLNLIVAILANTYNIFDTRSNGLFLSKILASRDELIYDENYGSFLCAMPPVNALQIPFIPLSLYIRKGLPLLETVNELNMTM